MAAPDRPPAEVADCPSSLVVETGIKIIDIFAPLKRGGHIGQFSPLAGAGFWVLVGQLTQNLVALHDGCVVFAGLETGAMTADSLALLWRSELGVSDRILEERLVQVFAGGDASPSDRRRTVETALNAACDYQTQGREVFLFVDGRLALTEGVLPLLRRNAPSGPESAVTTIYLADFSPGAEPPEFGFLDAVITFSRSRVRQGLWPAVDPLRSWSRLLREGDVDDEHARVAQEACRLLLRYGDLHVQYEHRGFDALFYLYDLEADQTVVTRARRLTRFLTQPFVGVEPYTCIPGERVALSDALAGCRAVIDGDCDHLPEDAFRFTGTLDQVLARAEA